MLISSVSRSKKLKELKIVNFYYFSSRCENRAVHVNTVWQRLNSEGIFVIFLSPSLSFRLYAMWERIFCCESLSLSHFRKLNSCEIYDWMFVDDDNKMRWDGNKSFLHHNFHFIVSLGVYYTLNNDTTLIISLQSVNHAQTLNNEKKWEFFISS